MSKEEVQNDSFGVLDHVLEQDGELCQATVFLYHVQDGNRL